VVKILSFPLGNLIPGSGNVVSPTVNNATSTKPAVARPPDPLVTFKFQIEIDSIIEGMFSECTGLQAKREIVQYKEGGVNSFVHQLPGRISYGNVKLLRGLGSAELFNWFMAGIYDGCVSYTNISILMYGWNTGTVDNELEVVRRWTLERAFPVTWSGPSLKTSDRQVAVQTVEIAHHGVILVT
jgi:phage tail-like protein